MRFSWLLRDLPRCSAKLHKHNFASAAAFANAPFGVDPNPAFGGTGATTFPLAATGTREF